VLKVKAMAVSSGIARSPSVVPVVRQIEQGTRTMGRGMVCLRLAVAAPGPNLRITF
jgi:hypothetical protein